MPFGRRRKGTAKQNTGKVFVDLSDYEISGDASRVSVKLTEVHSAADAKKVNDLIGTGAVIIIDLSKFDGGLPEKELFFESIRRTSRSEGYSVNGNGAVYIAAPSDTAVKRI